MRAGGRGAGRPGGSGRRCGPGRGALAVLGAQSADAGRGAGRWPSWGLRALMRAGARVAVVRATREAVLIFRSSLLI